MSRFTHSRSFDTQASTRSVVPRTGILARRIGAATAIAALSGILLTTNVGAEEMPARDQEGRFVGNAKVLGPAQQVEDTETAVQNRLTKDEIETILPVFLTSSEARQLAASLEVHLRNGDQLAAKHLIDRVVEASTFAHLASDWLDQPALLAMLHAQGIRGAEQAIGSDATADLRSALQREREHAEVLAREHAAATEKLAALQTSHDRHAAAAGEIGDLRRALQREREHAEVLAREHAAATEKLAALQASHDRHAAAAGEIGDLRRALQREREHAEVLAREHAAAAEKLAALQTSQANEANLRRATTAGNGPPPVQQGTTLHDSSQVGRGVVPPRENPLVKRADALLATGDVSGARLLLERASEAGDYRAMLLLAETFDPQALANRRVLGVPGDAVKAQELRARARALQNRAPGTMRAESANEGVPPALRPHRIPPE